MTDEELRKFVREVADETKGNIVVADFAVAVARKAATAEHQACLSAVKGVMVTDHGLNKWKRCVSAIEKRSNA